MCTLPCYDTVGLIPCTSHVIPLAHQSYAHHSDGVPIIVQLIAGQFPLYPNYIRPFFAR